MPRSLSFNKIVNHFPEGCKQEGKEENLNFAGFISVGHTVNIYRYKTIEANGNTGVIPTTSKSFSIYREFL